MYYFWSNIRQRHFPLSIPPEQNTPFTLMSRPKLLGLIGSFSDEEKEQFPLFLKSPFFLAEDKSEEMSQLFSCYLNAANAPNKELPSNPELYAASFGGKSYSEARLERAKAKLGQLVEQFLITRHYLSQDNSQQQALDLLGVLRRKGLDAHFQKNLQRIKKDADENHLESSKNYDFKYRLVLEEHEWSSYFNNGKDSLALPDLVQNLDLFYLTVRTELKNRFVLQQIIAPFETPEVFKLEIDNTPLSAYYEQISPLLAIRKEIHRLFSKPSPEKQDFEKLLDLISLHEHSISQELIPELYTYIRNFCTVLINNGHSEINEVQHKIHQDNLSRGFFYYDGLIHPYAFLNITLIALNTKNIEWAKHFVASHRHKIVGKDETEDLYSLCLALCFFEAKQYDLALQHLTFPALYPAFLLQARRLELKIYFETQSPLLSHKIDAFRKYLERTAQKTTAVAHRDRHLKFVNFLLQLAQSRSKDAYRSRQLIKRIEAKKPVADRMWLLEKAREMG
jgi:hypothetical protein